MSGFTEPAQAALPPEHARPLDSGTSPATESSEDGIVYVVDDEIAVRRSLARLIRSVNLDVETFPSAQAFHQHKRERRPCCLVLDVRLPGVNGLELQRALGHTQRTMPIIFITGRGNVPMSVRAMKGGALDFLQKPFDSQELLDAIGRALLLSRDGQAQDAKCRIVTERLGTLTARERQVMGLVVKGMLNKQIASVLGVAEKTIKIHRGRVMRKMQAGSVAELVRMSHELEPIASPAPAWADPAL